MIKDSNGIKRAKTDYKVFAVSNTIAILELLGEFEHELTLSEISDRLALTKSNTSKLLATLEQFDYVEYNKNNGSFTLGVKTFQIAQTYIKKLSIAEISYPYLKEITDILDESSYVGIVDNGTVVYLNMVDTSKPIRLKPRVGHIGHAYATAIGKAQLSKLDNQEIEILFRDGFQSVTENTVNSITDLIKALDVIRDSGYAIDNEEFEKDVVCVAVPVMDFMGKATAGIGVSAPKVRMSNERIVNEIAPLLIKTAMQLSFKFGYSESE